MVELLVPIILPSSCLSWIVPDHIVTFIVVFEQLLPHCQPNKIFFCPTLFHFTITTSASSYFLRRTNSRFTPRPASYLVLHTHDRSTPLLSSVRLRLSDLWQAVLLSACNIYRMVSRVLERTRRLWKRARLHVTPPPLALSSCDNIYKWSHVILPIRLVLCVNEVTFYCIHVFSLRANEIQDWNFRVGMFGRNPQ
jgi:hypothetical protein